MTSDNDAGFRRVWIGSTISATGDAASWIALVALVLGSAHGSVAVLAVCYTAPVAVGGLVAGWALDRFDRRRLLAADAALRALVFALVPLSAVLGTLPALLLYTVAGAYGLLKMTSLAGFPALIPQLVDDESLSKANALEGASYGLASLIGAGLGGLAIGALGHRGAVVLIALDALSYLVFAATLASARPRPLRSGPDTSGPGETSPRGTGSTGTGSTGTGSTGLVPVLRLVLRRPVLRSITAMFALFNIGEGMLIVFLPHRAAALGLGQGGYGYLVAALTGGELAAAALLARHSWRLPLVPSILVCQLTAAAIVLALTAASVPATVAAMAALGFVSAPMTAWAQTLRMLQAPATMHGRLFAVLRTTMQATPPAGAALAAILGRYGPAAVIGVVAVIMGMPVLVAAFDLLRPGPDPVPAP